MKKNRKKTRGDFDTMMIFNLLTIIIVAIIAYFTIKVILNVGSTVLKIALHLITGWVLLALVNILPGINIPINTITVIISGFGGVTGTLILVIFYVLF